MLIYKEWGGTKAALKPRRGEPSLPAQHFSQRDTETGIKDKGKDSADAKLKLLIYKQSFFVSLRNAVNHRMLQFLNKNIHIVKNKPKKKYHSIHRI